MQLFEYTTEIALLIVLISVVSLTSMGIEIGEPMKNISMIVVSAHFGASIPKK